jgi:hypothetical protein
MIDALKGAMQRRPAVNKSSTVMRSGKRILKQQKLAIGMDLGDRSTRYCIHNEAGDVILERGIPTTKKGMDQAFGAIPRSRIALAQRFDLSSFRATATVIAR